jgi:predicted short-subunit dehydrogenase-like oxidoreductase (DUF2520 family)
MHGMKEIVIIGAGNVGTHLTLALKNAGYSIKQVYSRNLSNADVLASLVDAEPISDLKLLVRNASFYLISVSDAAILSVSDGMPNVKGIVAHTAGSIELSTLNRFENHGVIYPFQTFTKDRGVDFTKVPILIEGNRANVRHDLTELAASISDNVQDADTNKRATLHVAAVFSSNFVNHLYSVSQDLVEVSGLDFNLLKPLIAETTQKALTMNPIDAQTGPARRKDFDVMGQHMEKLKDLKLFAEIYGIISKSIVNTYHPGSPFFK